MIFLWHDEAWEIALAAGRASEVYEIVGDRDDTRAGRSSSPSLERRLQRELRKRGEASPSMSGQEVGVGNFYSRCHEIVLCERTKTVLPLPVSQRCRRIV